MANQPMIKVTLPDTGGGVKEFTVPATSEMEVREIYSATLTPMQQTRFKITPIITGEEKMRLQIEEQNEIEKLKAEIEILKAAKPSKTK